MHQNHHFSAAIFDLDGTLLDSMGVWVGVDRDFLARRGIPMPPDYSEVLSAMSFPVAARYTKERFSLPEDEPAIMAEWHDMAVDAYAHKITCKPGAAEYLRMLKQKGVRIAAATASQPEFYVPALQRCGIYDLFEVIVESAHVARGKGFPDIYLRAAELLETPVSACVVFEDIAPGMRGAKDGGFFGVGVYEAHNKDQKALESIADIYIHAYAELMTEEFSLF